MNVYNGIHDLLCPENEVKNTENIETTWAPFSDKWKEGLERFYYVNQRVCQFHIDCAVVFDYKLPWTGIATNQRTGVSFIVNVTLLI